MAWKPAAALLLAALLALSAHPALARRPAPGYCAGERLVFDISWGVVPAGEAILEVMPETEVDGVPARHFRMTASTNPFADVFFKVRDQADAYTDHDVSRSLLYLKRQREGSYKRDITVRFFWDKSRAQYSNVINGPKEPIVVLPGTFDPLSVFYALRNMSPENGGLMRTPVTDGVKAVMGEARIVGRERIKVPAGEFDVYVVEPDLKHIGGVFKKSPDAKLRIWVTADERRIPVQISSKVVVGSFLARLREMVLPGCGPKELASDAPEPEAVRTEDGGTGRVPEAGTVAIQKIPDARRVQMPKAGGPGRP